MNYIKIFLTTTLLMMAFTMSGCQGNNSDTPENNTTTPTDPTDPVTPPIINLLEPTITISQDNQSVTVKLTAFQNGQKLTSGTISVQYPTEITQNGADGGTFLVDNITVTNGEAIFTFVGPSTIKAQSDLVFVFSYLENTATITKNLIVSYVPELIPGSPVPTVILTTDTVEVTQNSQSVSIDVSVVDSNNNPFPTGEVKIVYPNDVQSGRDVGIFTQLSVPVTNGIASFTYSAPKVLDENTSDLVFKFYHEDVPADSKTFTITLNPDQNQTVSTSYKLTGSYLDGNVTMNLESSKQIAFYLKDEQGTEVEESKIASIKVTLLNIDLADLRDINGVVDNNITLSKSGASVYVVSSTTSGIVPIQVVATFTDANGNTQIITEYLNVVIVSGPPTAMSISYVSTSNDTANSQFNEKMVVSLTDKYSNRVNSNPGLSVALIAGYAEDSSGSLSYMYHTFGGTIDTSDDKFKVAKGTVVKALITNSGSGYSTAPTVTLAGGDTNFRATSSLSTYGGISTITLLSGGSEYIAPPVVTAGGSGSHFSATAILSSTGSFFATTTNNSGIDILTLENEGQGYTTVPTISASGGVGFDALAVLKATGSIKFLTIDTAGSDYEVGDVLPVGGDGSGGSVKVQSVDSGGGITGLVILDSGSGYTYATIDTLLAAPKNDAKVSATIGFSVKEIQLRNGGSGYSNETLTVSGGSPTVAAQVSARIGYAISSVTVDNLGSGYRSAVITFAGGKVDGSTSADALATATITYPVAGINITNPGKNYTNGALTLSGPSALKGVQATGYALVFADFSTVSQNSGSVNDDFLMTFGDGYSFNASGKWDITSVNANDDFERVLKDQYDGNTTSNLGFAIGNNFRQDRCLSGQEWVATATTPIATFDSNGLAEIDIAYSYYLAAKDVILSVNLVGAQNSTGQTVKLGEAVKHTLRGTGLIADKLSLPGGLDHAIYRMYIELDGALDQFRNVNFTYTVSSTSVGLTIHAIHDSMDDGIQNCPANNNDEGRAYVEVEVSTTTPSTITLDNLVISREFK